MASYLVTGGAGFIGSHLVEILLADGCHVRVLDNFSTGLMANLAELPKSPLGKLEIICGDIRDPQELDHAMRGVNGVFHLAALVSVPVSLEKPSVSFAINCTGTQLVLDAARKNGIERIVMASSAAVYGRSQNLPLREEEPSVPLSPYGLEKSFGEQMANLYAKLYRTNVTCLRLFNVFGPRQSPTSPYSGVVSIFAKKAAAAERPLFYGSGEQTRDFVFVKDVARVFKQSMESCTSGFQIYNVGAGKEITIKELWDALCEISGCKEEAEHVPKRDGDIETSVADISKIRSALDFYPSGDFKSNLSETYYWLRAQYRGIRNSNGKAK